jgi:hypothetical protein
VVKSSPTRKHPPKTGTHPPPLWSLNQADQNISLKLNVWAPAGASSSSNLPVKVWIYGGGQEGGGIANPLFNGCNLAAHNTLVVTINYRLGPLGYLTLDAAGIRGNFATQDLLLGLDWVQSNIAAFGGDPVSCSSIYLNVLLKLTTAIEKGCLIRRVRRRGERFHPQYPAASHKPLQRSYLGIRSRSTACYSGSREHPRQIVCNETQLYHR